MSFDSLLIHTCQLGTLSTSSNSLGETLEYWSYSNDNTICRLVPVTATQRVELPGEFNDVSYRAYFNSGVAISGGKRVQCGGLEYRVRDARLDSAGHHLTCLISEVVG